MRAWLAALGVVLLAGCATQGEDLAPNTVGKVNLKRYQGMWYEQARLPMFFQRDCAQSEAHYQLKADGNVDVLNRCRTLDGEMQEAHGTARSVSPGINDRLKVSFDTWFSGVLPGVATGDYWIIYLSDDYRYAIVGHPNHKYLWLLTRSRTVPEDIRQLLMAKARQQGYDTSRLIWRTPDSDIRH